MTHLSLSVKVNSQGRLVIPAAIRREASILPGEEVNVRLEHGTVVIESRREAAKKLCGMFQRPPGSPSAVDELIAERRAEAAKEP